MGISRHPIHSARQSKVVVIPPCSQVHPRIHPPKPSLSGSAQLHTVSGTKLGWLTRSSPCQQRHVPGRRRCTAITSSQQVAAASADAKLLGDAVHVAPDSVSVILLAGGVGKRMGAGLPKQYLLLRGQPIAMYSLKTFSAMPEVGQIVVVCDPSYRDMFQECHDKLPRRPALCFALPGAERQDSVFNGLQLAHSEAALVAVHDSARPLIDPVDAALCMADGLKVGAAVLGVPVKPTIKEVDAVGRVVKTLRRASLWEVQTPQVIRPQLLQEGFELVRREKLEVTDDVSIIEALGLPVQITAGSYTNIKVTTPDDMSVAEGFLAERDAAAIQQQLDAALAAAAG